MQSPWQASSDAAATEHTGEPQLAGYVHTHAVNYDGNATEHADGDGGASTGSAAVFATAVTEARPPRSAPELMETLRTSAGQWREAVQARKSVSSLRAATRRATLPDDVREVFGVTQAAMKRSATARVTAEAIDQIVELECLLYNTATRRCREAK